MANPEDSDEGRLSRRKMLIGAGLAGGAVWITPAVLSHDVASASPSQSPSTAAVDLQKDPNGTVANRCLRACNAAGGPCSNAGRGGVLFTYTPATNTICAAITLGSGPSITGRDIYILQSNGTTCLFQSQIGDWAASPADGPQTFCTTVVAGATRFAVHMPISGGGGTDVYTSFQVCLSGGVISANCPP